MDKAYFLITDVDVLDGSYQVLQRLSSPSLNTIVYAIVSDFQTLRNFRGDFPHANFLFLDLKKSVNVNKELLSCLPELDCILNYSGDLLANSLHRVRAVTVAKTTCLDADSVSIRAIHEVLESNEKIGTVVINIQKKERYGCSGAEALSKLIKKESNRRFQEESEGGIRFHPGKKFVVPKPGASPAPSSTPQNLPPSEPQPPSTSTINPNRFANLSPLLLQETQPLLNHPPTDSNPPAPRPIFSRLCATLFCCIYPRCFILHEMEVLPPRFAHEPQIRAYTRGEQHLVLRRKLKRLMDNAEVDWYRIMSRIDSDEVLQIEELALRMKQISPFLLRMSTSEESSSESVKSDRELLPGDGATATATASERGHWQIASFRNDSGSSSSGSSKEAKAREREIQMELELEKELREQEERETAFENRRRRQSSASATASTSGKRVTFVWDANREYHELADGIRTAMDEERKCKEDEFYSLWVGRMLAGLRGNKDKCLAKYEKLYFETFRRPAPFE